MSKKFVEFFKDSPDGKLSSSRLWYHLGNGALTYGYIIVAQKVASAEVPNLEGFAWVSLVYAAAVVGNKLANKMIGAKYGTNATETPK